MKRIIFICMMVATIVQSAAAQHHKAGYKKFWMDLQVAQHIGLAEWSDVGYVNDGFPVPAVTEIRGVANFYLARRPVFGAFIDMGLGIMPAPAMRSFDLGRMPMPKNGMQYYLREMVSESGMGKASAHFKVTAGLFGDFRAGDRWKVMPYLGAGGLTMARRSYEMILKEDGSNIQYRTIYAWAPESSEDSGSGSGMLGYWTARLNFQYKVSKRSSLLFGLEYTGFFGAMNFYGRYTNTFNGNIQRSVKIEGSRMSMLGVSVGLSFR